MIVDEHITGYLHSLDVDADSFLEELRGRAEAEDVPVIRREMERFLRVLCRMKRPERILEIGTGIGYSASFLSLNCETVKEIDTLENDPPRIEEAKETFAHLNAKAKIRLIEGDAAETVKTLDGPYDMIFLDGPKAQYISMLPDLLALLPAEGILLADNVLQDGQLSCSRFVTERRNRTIHERMREFVWEVTHRADLETSVITIGDGVTLSVKK